MRKNVFLILAILAIFGISTVVEWAAAFYFLNKSKRTPECTAVAEQYDIHRLRGWSNGDLKDLVEASMYLSSYHALGCDPREIRVLR